LSDQFKQYNTLKEQELKRLINEKQEFGKELRQSIEMFIDMRKYIDAIRYELKIFKHIINQKIKVMFSDFEKNIEKVLK